MSESRPLRPDVSPVDSTTTPDMTHNPAWKASSAYASVSGTVSLSVALDVDPGIDDALAIMLALRSAEVQVEMVTTVAGNGPVEMTTRNALRVLHYMGASHVPVYAGAGRPLHAPFHGALGYHGPDALGNVSIADSPRSACHTPAWEALYDFASTAPGTRTIVATGPLTNLALAFRSHPDLPGILRGVVIMGGAFRLTPYGEGNETPYAEFNIWQDPEAAETVFESRAHISVVGLDISNNPSTALDPADAQMLRTCGSDVARLAAELAAFTFTRHNVFQLHDPLALATVLDPALFDFVRGHVRVRTDEGTYRGMTELFEDEQEGNVNVACEIDAPAFKRLFMKRLMMPR